MNSGNSVFKPRYPYNTRLAITVLPLLFLVMLIIAAFAPYRLSIYFWAGSLLLGLITSLLPFFVIRQILFVNEMVIRRYFLPDCYINHNEYKRIAKDAILAAGRRIRIGSLENSAELLEMTQHWSAIRTLKAATGAAKKDGPLYPSRGYGSYASFWGLIFGLIIMFLAPPTMVRDPRWVLGGTFLSVYVLFLYILPRLFYSL